MFAIRVARSGFAALLLLLAVALPARAQSFRVQCPPTTITHGDPASNVHGQIKCQQISGGDGYSTMADGVQTYMFSFGPLSGLYDISMGLPGTQPASVFNTLGDPYNFRTNMFNGAVGLAPDPNTVPAGQITGHVDPRPIMDVGVMNGNIPAPMMAIDEDDEFFLTLTNVGMIMRPDLFEKHTVHFHGYPNASSFYDGVPDASIAINIGGSFTYYYLAPDAGTYFWHCHITPPEHLQMGMVGQIYVRPRQDRVAAGASLYGNTANPAIGDPNSLLAQQIDSRTACYAHTSATTTTPDLTKPDILCSAPLPPAPTVPPLHANNKSGTPTLYAYNDGDGSTAYDVEYPVQMHGFDPNFHFIGMTFNPEPFTDMKDKYFMLNGRSYPDTITAGPLTTASSDGALHFSQPLPTIINVPLGGKALLRISNLDVTEYQTLASLGIPMHVIGINARLLRDLAGNDMTYFTNSITLGGGESLDVILDASDTASYPLGTYYLYTPNLDHLSNDAENFGGLMTEVHVCNAVDPVTKLCS
ncbi:multicopper oxidase family protein [uncultured Ralstonia sp.]|jgi:FtsP/CotA-like multicopper oxidase with cupredoxin domain|uniref:multicopper oxidase family protein n=1 Tax=Ralstonia sp. TaxID=54061 RepID=UPI001EA5601F|nr:multicopper oxidase family protein [uncultured Ralstonia sp.]UCF24269.1 MAG: multicopper oxidase family protein [Ralstonia sp.]